MKLASKYTKRVIKDNGVEITLLINDYSSKKQLDNLELNQDYNIELKKPRSKRSLNQNAMLWELINKLAYTLNMNDLDVYALLLKECNAKSELIKCKVEAYDALRQVFRCVTFLNYDSKNEEYGYYRCYIGSSKFNTKEMTELIDKAIDWCYQNEIYIDDITGTYNV